MPKIVIQEDNLTRATGSGVGTDIVYIPGFMGAGFSIKDEDGKDITPYNTPILCTNMDEFEMYFGSDADTYEDESGNERLDTGFIYAKECLNVNLPVIYEAIKAEEVNIQIQDPTKNIVNNIATITLNNTITTTTLNGSTKTLTAGDPFILSYQVLDDKGNDVVIADSADKGLAVTIYEVTGDETVTETELEGNPYKFQGKGSAVNFKIVIAQNGLSNNVTYTIKFNINEGYFVRPFELALGSVETSVDYLYSVLPDRLDRIADKSMYQVKYITSGGYPSYRETDNGVDDSLAQKMMAVARTRGDAIALIDHENQPERTLAGIGSIYNDIKSKQYADGTFGAMFTPYASYTCTTINDLDNMVQVLPASYAYLMNLGRTIQTSPNWLAIAGVNRGVVAGIDSLQPKQVLTNTIADMYQPTEDGTAINAITEVKPYGLTIWGNRTLAKVATGLTAEHFLNTRNMISDIKKNAYNVAKSLLFEQDSDSLWLSFKAGVSPLLEQLIAGNGLSGYQLNRLNTKYNKKPLGKGEVACTIKIFPRYAVEAFEITVVMADEDVSVS